VDDGAGSFADSVEMATLAASSGIRTIVVTPHSNIPNTFENYWTMEMQSVFDRLQKQVNDKKIPVTFLRGQEIFLTSDYMTLIKQGKLISINHSRYFLVEFDPYENASVVLRKLQKILAEGYVPIVAHPERYSFVHEHADMIYRMKEIGCLIQINKGSIKGRFGRRAMKCAFEILGNYDADFIASDGHSQYSRTPYLADAYEIICERFSSDYADLLLSKNPQKVIDNKTVYSF
jgi:protein-tyrosine phosphatase